MSAITTVCLPQGVQEGQAGALRSIQIERRRCISYKSLGFMANDLFMAFGPQHKSGPAVYLDSQLLLPVFPAAMEVPDMIAPERHVPSNLPPSADTAPVRSTTSASLATLPASASVRALAGFAFACAHDAALLLAETHAFTRSSGRHEGSRAVLPSTMPAATI